MQAASEPCSECGSTSFVVRDGFRWCTGCGLGTPVLVVSHRVPGVGADTDHAPENQLSFGKDLGNPAVNSRFNSKALFNVLGRNKKENLGIRSIQVRNECMRSQEYPIAQRMKDYGSHLCKRYGFGDNVLLSNALGFNLKWISTILTMQNDGRHSKELTRAAFILNIKKFFGEKKALDIMREIWAEKDPDRQKLFLSKARELICLDKLVI